MLDGELISRYPQVFHMAEDGSWPSIQQNGLLSTSALLTLYGISGPQRDKIESQWRPAKIIIRAPGLPDVVIRDQIPLAPGLLTRCLEAGISVAEWYRLINAKVFFWPDRTRLEWFLSAVNYREAPHVVISLETRRLVALLRSRVTLSSINSGSAYPGRTSGVAPSRGRETFRPIEDYPSRYVAELVVNDGVPDLSAMLISVERWIAHRSGDGEPTFESLGRLWP